MEEILDTILNENELLFGQYKELHKISIGFTNTIFSVDNKYIIKVCTNIDNEEKFIKEINFYNSNKKSSLIPKLYLSSIDKTNIPYMYEILEKVDGVTLYDVWHTLNEKEREEIIKQLCEAMKQFHSNVGGKFDWSKKTTELFITVYSKAKLLNVFNGEELELIKVALAKFPELLKSDEFVLVHNDLHFDNIFYKDGKVKLIDFERSVYAPKDFELDIIYRMIRKPWKFASEENEKYTKLSDYENIMRYIEKYYPELINIDNLYERLAIYDMIYYLKQYINNSSITELKEDILNAALIVASSKDKNEVRK